MKDIVTTIKNNRKTVTWGLAFLFFLTVAGFFIVPPVLKSILIKQLSKSLHREVSIEKVQFNPYTLSLQIKGFRVKERGSPETFLSFEEFYTNIQSVSLLKRGLVVREAKLKSPHINIKFDQNRTYNFSDLLVKGEQKPEEPKEPFRFSLNNISITDGSIDFSDGLRNTRHTIKDIAIAVPFISNLPYQTETFIQPAFTATVNGTPVSLTGRTKPFADSLETRFNIDIKDFDLPYYLAYVPFDMKYSLTSGRMDAVIAVSFQQHTDRHPTVGLIGAVTSQGVAAQDRNGGPLFNLPFLGISINTPDIMARRLQLTKIFMDVPSVNAVRAKDGRMNLLALIPETEKKKPSEKETGKETPFRIDIGEIQVKEGSLSFVDHAVDGAFSTRLEHINVKVTGFSNASEQRAEVEGSFETGYGESLKLAGGVVLEPFTSEGKVEITRVPLSVYDPYYRKAVLFDITDGRLDLSTDFAVRGAGNEMQVALSGLSAQLDALALKKRGEKDDLIMIPSISVGGTAVDMAQKQITVGSFSTDNGVVRVRRYEDGKINLAKLVPDAQDQGTQKDAVKSDPWNVTVKELLTENYTVKFEDLSASDPVALNVDRFRLQGSDISTVKNEKGKLTLSFRFQGKGSVSAGGAVGIHPALAQLGVKVKDFEINPFQPYFTKNISLLVTSGALLVDGSLTISETRDKTFTMRYKGNSSIVRFASVDKEETEDFLKWNSLYFGGMDIGYKPLSVTINEVALSDFYSRIIVHPDGTLNVQGIVVSEKTSGKEQPEAKPAEQSAEEDSDKQAAKVKVGKITLQGGTINFTDNHIEPHYTANLLEIGGRVSGMTSEENTSADVDLRGRLDNYAPLEITGKINPLLEDLYVDLKADFRNIDLSPVTSYSGKYVGYTIEKGKLTLGMKYLIADRKLDAQNNVFLDQLTFGDRIESPEATKLPVKLAVALLKNRKGEINLDLPVSGNFDDPDFHIGRIVLKIIINLLVKVATSPFALLGALFGGGEELSVVEFDYGMSVIDEPSLGKLDNLIKALYDRPALKLEIAGYIDAEKDKEGLRQVLFDRKIRAQKLKDMIKKGEQSMPVDEVTIEKDEYEKYLLKAYKEEKFPKPRNFIGMLKDLPVPEMEKLMLTYIEIKDSDLKELAAQRAMKVKDYILQSKKVGPERVFLVEPKTIQPKKKEKFRDSRVEFTLK